MVKIEGYQRPYDRLTALKFLFDHHVKLEIDPKNPNHWIMDFGDSFVVDWMTTAPDITFDEIFDQFIRPSIAGMYKATYECCPHDTDVNICEVCNG